MMGKILGTLLRVNNTRWLRQEAGRQCVWSVKPYGIKVSLWGSGTLGIVIYGNPLVHKVGHMHRTQIFVSVVHVHVTKTNQIPQSQFEFRSLVVVSSLVGFLTNAIDHSPKEQDPGTAPGPCMTMCVQMCLVCLLTPSLRTFCLK